MPDSPCASTEDWRALVAACPRTAVGRRDLLLLWCAYSLALSEQHVVQLQPRLRVTSLPLPNGRCIDLGLQAAEAVGRVLEEARALAAELGAETSGALAFPLHPRTARKRCDVARELAGRPDVTWCKLRRGGLLRAYHLDGWRVATRLAHAVELSLTAVLELADEDSHPAPLRTVPLLER